tara:strand:+ start:10852 stop:11019 length:168 start_codon:yes stop_codon:yes gene_type:complete
MLVLILLAIPNNLCARISRQYKPIDIILAYRQKETPPTSDGAKFREKNGVRFIQW